MIGLADKQIRVNNVHKAIIEKAYSTMCHNLAGCNMVDIKLVDNESPHMQIDEGDGEDEGTFLVHIRFSDSFGGFLYNLIDAIGFVNLGTGWLVHIAGSPTMGDLWFDVYQQLPEEIRKVF